jgi:hypothetical protein
MRRVEPWHHTVKLYHYTEFMDTINNIINSTSMDELSSIREITIPRLQRMRHRTYYIRNTQPELSRGIKTIADCLIDLYSTPSLLSQFHVITIKIISWRFSFILQHKKGEERQRQLEDLKLQVEEQKPLPQATFTELINSILNM